MVAACALALGAGASLEAAAVLANHAAGIVVGEVGTATVSAAQLRADLAGQRQVPIESAPCRQSSDPRPASMAD